MPLVDLRDVHKQYGSGPAAVTALSGVDLCVEEGRFAAILGRSGAGKSTLMNVLAGLDQADSGTVRIAGDDLMALGPRGMARYRATRIGIVFQSFHLLAGRSALENTAMPLVLDGLPRAERKRRAEEALASVGLAARMRHSPAELSGGEQQRVAIARAIVRDPQLLLCDEPTGNLDSTTADSVMDILCTLQREHGRTIVMITHEEDLARRAATQLIVLEDGRVSRTEALVAREGRGA